MGLFDAIVEKRIRAAQEEGAFDNLPGKGKPLNLLTWRVVRLAKKIDAGVDFIQTQCIFNVERFRTYTQRDQKWSDDHLAEVIRGRQDMQARNAQRKPLLRTSPLQAAFRLRRYLILFQPTCVVASADVCLAILQDIPMFRTTYPNKVFDYMAAGRPVILVIDGVIREVVEKAGCGIPGRGKQAPGAGR